MNIKKCEKLAPVKYTPHPPFGSVFTPHILRMHLHLDGPKEFNAEILPLADEPMSPTTTVLHYGQSIFEGMKAFKQKDGRVGIFRADLHAARFRKSAQRMVMADFPEDIFLQCIKEYTAFVADNVPSDPDHSLYLRPLLIAADNKIKVGTSQKNTFYIMSSIAGGYFGGAKAKRARVLVNRHFVRAYPGGMGEAKTAANYAASIWPQRLAAQKECDQVLFLDATHHDYIDELGGMNFFAIRGNELLTPVLNGCILHGVTRRSILEIAPSLNLKPVETKMSFTELKKQIRDGSVTEAFACGTAAVISPIGEFVFQENLDAQPELIGLAPDNKATQSLLERLKAVQRGEVAAPGDWIFRV
jgi:branched-chain amino acid aminotransferase